jgi:ABC-type amino acid transport substrate-binding protein
VVTVGVDASPPPPLCFALPDAPGFQGFEVDLLAAIAERLRVELRWRAALWSEILAALRAGHLDMICTAATITPERTAIVQFSDPYLTTRLALVTRAERPIGRAEDLRGCVVGVRVATVAEDFVRARAQAAAVTTYDLNVDTYQALRDGRVDAIVDDWPIADHFARAVAGLGTALPISGTDFSYGLVFAPGSDALRAAMNRALAALRADGTWERLSRRWIPPGIAT